MSERIVYIGGAAAHAVDSQVAIPQLLTAAKMDYFIMDCMAEMTIASLVRMRETDKSFDGFDTDFVEARLAPHLREILARKIKVVANCGGLNPRSCARAIEASAAALGLSPKVAYVEGDDILGRLDEIWPERPRDMFSGGPFPAHPASANVYLGGFPIAQALATGADIVVTGRVADSALCLGALIHEFGWKPTEFDKLAAGTLIGHLMECGQQVTGGTFTDWRDVPDWTNIGYPIAECRADGTCVIAKPEGTGGLITPATVAEQMLYEVSDPQAYYVADATADFSQVRLEQVGVNRVRVSGCVGRAPTRTYKATVTWLDGWRGVALHPVIGLDAVAKAERQSRAFLERTRRLLRDRNMGEFRKTNLELVGAESAYGAHGRRRDAREVMARISAEHENRTAVDLFMREQRSLLSAMAVGATNVQGGTVIPVVRLFSGLVDKSRVSVQVTFGGKTEPGPAAYAGDFNLADLPRAQLAPAPADADAGSTVPLIDLAWVRSGDKGNLFNVAVIARRPEYLPYLTAALTPEHVAQWYEHVFDPGAPHRVDRYAVPGVSAINLIVHDALGGGGHGSMRMDNVAKGMGQQVLEMPIAVTPSIARALADANRDLGAGLEYEGTP
jgi:hypothetical protein